LPINFENYFTPVNSRYSRRAKTSVNNQLNIPLLERKKRKDQSNLLAQKFGT